MAEAWTLVQRLGTGEVSGDTVIGDRTFRTKSSEELTGLHITLEWARAAGLARRKGNAVVAVKKHAGLVDRPSDLLARATRNRPDPGDGVRSLSLQGATPYRYRWVCRAVVGSSRS